MSKTKNNKKVLKGFLIAFLTILLIVVGYATYFVASFSRVGDVAIMPEVGNSTSSPVLNREYSILSWNIGFGAYSSDYSFFMDGGKSGRAKSEQAVKDNLQGILQTIEKMSNNNLGGVFDFACFQEVDVDGTRSYNVNQKQLLNSGLSGYSATFAQNYDSPFIAFPLFDMHGKNRSGLYSFANFKIESAKRVELPIESGFTKFFDLDRCFVVNRIPTSNGKTLVIINLHLSAYTSDGTIADEQIKIVADFCKKEVEMGNYVICAGDFNKDLLRNSSEIFGVSGEDYNWAKAFKEQLLENSGMNLVAPLNTNEPVASCRNANIPYEKGKTFEITVDGFLVSNNVNIVSSEVYNAEFAHSDHNPVILKFKLNAN